MIRSIAATSALLLITLIIAASALRPSAHTTTQHQFTLAAVVFQSGSPASPTFTFQGVFSDPQTGNHIDGPANIRIGIGDGPQDSDLIVSLTEAAPNYINGRFTAEVDLLDPSAMLNINDPHIVILSADGEDTPLIPRIPMRYTPYAWTAEYARVSELAREAVIAEEALIAAEADVAQEADFSKFANAAASAQIAENLTSQAIVLTVNTANGWNASTDNPPTATRRGDLVYLNGRVFKNLNVINTIATLPEGFHPAIEKRFMVSFAPNAIPVAVEVRIDPDGRVILGTGGLNGGSLWFDGIVFQAAP